MNAAVSTVKHININNPGSNNMKQLVLTAFLMSISFFYSEGFAKDLQPALIAMEASQQQALGIKSASVESVESAWQTPYPAKVVVPNSQLRVVSAPLGGLLKSLHVAEGETVEKGQTLAVLHSPQLLEQQSAYLLALTDLNLAATEKKRDAQLAKEGIIAKRRFLESSAKYTQLATRLEQFRQALILSGMSSNDIAKLKRTRKLSPTLSVYAPLSGVVLEQMATAGSQLNALDPVYKVGHLKPLWLEIHVPLEQLGTIAKGTEIKVVAPEITGKVITVGRMVHGADQGVLIRAEIQQGVDQLRPGQFVQAQIAQASSDSGISYRIPRSALVRNEGKTWVFTNSDKGFLPVAITLVKEEADNLIIKGNVSASSTVVVSGTAALKAAWLEGVE